MPEPPHLAARGGCWFEDGDLKVHLGVDHDFRAATKAHPAFIVDNVRALAQTLAQAGFAVKDDEPLEGYDRVYVTDIGLFARSSLSVAEAPGASARRPSWRDAT